MQRLQTALLVITAAAGILLSGTESRAASFRLFPFDPGLSDFIQNYRHAPDPKSAIDRYFLIRFDEFLDQAQKADQPHSRALLMAFYVHVIHDNPQLSFPFAKLIENISSRNQGKISDVAGEIVEQVRNRAELDEPVQ